MWLYARKAPGYSGVHTHHRTHVTLCKNTPGIQVCTPLHRTKVTVPVLV